MISFCPRCRQPAGSTIAQETILDITVDRCASCGGTWFDPSEFEQLVAGGIARGRADIEELDAASPDSSESNHPLPSGCPRCERGYFEAFPVLFEGLGASVLLDRCDVCEGVWIDRGELHRIVTLVDAAKE